MTTQKISKTQAILIAGFSSAVTWLIVTPSGEKGYAISFDPDYYDATFYGKRKGLVHKDERYRLQFEGAMRMLPGETREEARIRFDAQKNK